LSVKNWVKFFALGLVWGSSFFWIKIGLREAGPITVVFFRVFFAAIGLTIYFLLTRRRLPLKSWWIFLVIGLFNVTLPFMLVTWSEKYISSGLASVLNSTQPLMTALIASMFIKNERLTGPRIAGLVIGLAGVLILMSNRINGEVANQTLGIIAMLVAVLCYGSSAVFARINNSNVRPEDQALGQMAFGLMFIVPAMLAFESPLVLPVLPFTYIAFAWLGLLGSFFAGITWYGLINEIGPSRASMTMYMLPLVGVILGAVVLREKVDWRLIVGGLFILSAVILVNTNRKGTESLSPIPEEQC
jgi:drug/metabolite transporter (DMT)-like permease